MSLKSLNNTGDTIVEIMVVLAVLGMAIAISYATASRSLLAARGAQENSEATQLIQAQIEYLRAFAKSPSTDTTHYIFVGTGQYFCIDTTNGTVVAPNTFTAAQGPITDYSIYTPVPQCVNGFYHISIQRDSSNDSAGNPVDTFTATAVWDDVQGQGQDTVTITYRVHQP